MPAAAVIVGLESYLELVLLGLGSRAGVEEINGENLKKFGQHFSRVRERDV